MHLKSITITIIVTIIFASQTMVVALEPEVIKASGKR